MPPGSPDRKGEDGCTDQERVFAEQYAITLDVEGSARAAKYAESVCKSKAYRWLIKSSNDYKPHVHALVQKILAESTAKAHLTVERIDQEIARLAFSDIRNLYDENGSLKPPSEWPDDVASAVAGLDVTEEKQEGVVVGVVKKVKRWDKVGALTLAARRLALLQDKTEHSGDLVVVVNKPK